MHSATEPAEPEPCPSATEVDSDGYEVIPIRLDRVTDMFETPQAVALGQFPRFQSGVDSCIGEIQRRRPRRKIRLEVTLPVSLVEPELAGWLADALRFYCDDRMRSNRYQDRELQRGAVAALRIGVPLAILGLTIPAVTTQLESDATLRLVADLFGGVLAWVGLWFPLDQLIFYPLAYRRENRRLAALREAEVVVIATARRSK